MLAAAGCHRDLHARSAAVVATHTCKTLGRRWGLCRCWQVRVHGLQGWRQGAFQEGIGDRLTAALEVLQAGCQEASPVVGQDLLYLCNAICHVLCRRRASLSGSLRHPPSKRCIWRSWGPGGVGGWPLPGAGLHGRCACCHCKCSRLAGSCAGLRDCIAAGLHRP